MAILAHRIVNGNGDKQIPGSGFPELLRHPRVGRISATAVTPWNTIPSSSTCPGRLSTYPGIDLSRVYCQLAKSRRLRLQFSLSDPYNAQVPIGPVALISNYECAAQFSAWFNACDAR